MEFPVIDAKIVDGKLILKFIETKNDDLKNLNVAVLCLAQRTKIDTSLMQKIARLKAENLIILFHLSQKI